MELVKSKGQNVHEINYIKTIKNICNHFAICEANIQYFGSHEAPPLIIHLVTQWSLIFGARNTTDYSWGEPSREENEKWARDAISFLAEAETMWDAIIIRQALRTAVVVLRANILVAHANPIKARYTSVYIISNNRKYTRPIYHSNECYGWINWTKIFG